MVVIALVIFAVDVVFSAARQRVRLGRGRRSCFQLVGWLLGLFLALGWFRVALEITQGRTPEVGDVFKAEGYGPYIVASIVFGIGFFIGLVLCIIPGIIFAVVFGFYGFVAAEQGERRGRDGHASARRARSPRVTAGSCSASRSCSR